MSRPTSPGTTAGAGAAADLVAALKEQISNGTYAAGTRLPPERTISEVYGVSRPTVREALRALAAMNLIELRQGSGAYVSSLHVAVLLEPVRFALKSVGPSLSSLFEIRIALEPLAARLAAERATDADVKRLQAICQRTTTSRLSPKRLLALDVELHEMIFEAASDELLRMILGTLRELSQASRERTVMIAAVRTQTVRDHKAIVQAIARRKPLAAETAMRRHLERLRRASTAD